MASTNRKPRYRRVGDKRLIEVRVRTARQLFDARDPSPFRERDLDDDLVEYIVSSALEIGRSKSLKIVFHIEESEPKDLTTEVIRDSVRSFILYHIELQRASLRRFVRRSQLFLLIGALILATCLFVAQSIHKDETSYLLSVLREGLVIFGWVSLWKPIELVLFDWYPLYEKLQLHRRLYMSDIEINFAQVSHQ